MGTGANPDADLTGASVGDFAFVVALNSTTTATLPSGWTDLGAIFTGIAPVRTHLFYNPSLTSGEISTPPTFTMGASAAYTLIYSGASGANQLSTEINAGTGTSITIPGVTKGASCKNIVVFLSKLDSIDAATFPTNWATRFADTLTFRRGHAAGDIDAGDYTSGTDIDVTLTTNTSLNRDIIFRVVELT
jgi:hypothetical protein